MYWDEETGPRKPAADLLASSNCKPPQHTAWLGDEQFCSAMQSTLKPGLREKRQANWQANHIILLSKSPPLFHTCRPHFNNPIMKFNQTHLRPPCMASLPPRKS